MSSPASADPDPTLAFELRIGHSFTDRDLLLQALTHRSFCAERGGESYERLEFLGDAVLGLVVAERSYEAFPDLPEGGLAKVRASVVSATTLAEVARAIGLGECLRLGRGEEQSGGRDKPSILADTLEAVIGAVHVAGGAAASRTLVLRLFDSAIVTAAEGPGVGDHKTRLQELVARRYGRAPVYRLKDEGPDHNKRFFATVLIGDLARGSGVGSSKKQAEQEAARVAWHALMAEASD